MSRVPRSRAISELAAAAIGPALRRRGFANVDIAAHWPAIVGPHLARLCQPERITWPRRGPGESDGARARGATLLVRVDGPAAVELQHAAPQILERVNTFLGAGLVTRLRLVQAPLPRKARPRVGPRPCAPQAAARVDDLVAEIEDEALRRTLAALGRNIAASRSGGA
jgi:hypothetical protein